MQLAPIILFTYNRPWHCRCTLESLMRNPQAADSHLIVYCDGPKHTGERSAVSAVHSTVEAFNGFGKLDIIKRNDNMGLARSIITGVSEVIAAYGRGIILEDDLQVAPVFLDYMNAALHCYANDEDVASIHGYTYPVRDMLPETFFLRGADCWGWATWKRGWDIFEADGALLLNKIKQQGLLKEFDRGAFKFSRMLQKQVAGQIESWAIRWHAAAFLANRFTLYPGKSLVHNIGNDDSGTHCRLSDTFAATPSEHPIRVRRIGIGENQIALKAFKNFMRAHRNKSLVNRFKRVFGL